MDRLLLGFKKEVVIHFSCTNVWHHFKIQIMKATFIKVSEEKVFVTGEVKPEKPRSECPGKGFNCCPGEQCVLLVYNQALQSFNDSFKEVSNPELVHMDIPNFYGFMLDGIYPTYIFEFEVKEQYKDSNSSVWHFPSDNTVHTVWLRDWRKIAILSLSEPNPK